MSEQIVIGCAQLHGKTVQKCIRCGEILFYADGGYAVLLKVEGVTRYLLANDPVLHCGDSQLSIRVFQDRETAETAVEELSRRIEREGIDSIFLCPFPIGRKQGFRTPGLV